MLILDPVLVTVKSNNSQLIPGKNPRDCTRSKNRHVRPDPNPPEVDARLSFLSNQLWTPPQNLFRTAVLNKVQGGTGQILVPPGPVSGNHEGYLCLRPNTDSNHKAVSCLGSELNPDKAQGKIQSPQGQGCFFSLHSAALGMLQHQEHCKQTQESVQIVLWSLTSLAPFAGKHNILKVCARASQKKPQQRTCWLTAVPADGMQNIHLISKTISPTPFLYFISCHFRIHSINGTKI